MYKCFFETLNVACEFPMHSAFLPRPLPAQVNCCPEFYVSSLLCFYTTDVGVPE